MRPSFNIELSSLNFDLSGFSLSIEDKFCFVPKTFTLILSVSFIGKESLLFIEEGCTAIRKSIIVPKKATRYQNIQAVDLPVSFMRLHKIVIRVN